MDCIIRIAVQKAHRDKDEDIRQFKFPFILILFKAVWPGEVTVIYIDSPPHHIYMFLALDMQDPDEDSVAGASLGWLFDAAHYAQWMIAGCFRH